MGVEDGGATAEEDEVSAVIDGETPPLWVSVLIGTDVGEVLLIEFDEVTTGGADDEEEAERFLVAAVLLVLLLLLLLVFSPFRSLLPLETTAVDDEEDEGVEDCKEVEGKERSFPFRVCWSGDVVPFDFNCCCCCC